MFRTEKTMFRPPGGVSQAARIFGKKNVWPTHPSSEGVHDRVSDADVLSAGEAWALGLPSHRTTDHRCGTLSVGGRMLGLMRLNLLGEQDVDGGGGGVLGLPACRRSHAHRHGHARGCHSPRR